MHVQLVRVTSTRGASSRSVPVTCTRTKTLQCVHYSAKVLFQTLLFILYLFMERNYVCRKFLFKMYIGTFSYMTCLPRSTSICLNMLNSIFAFFIWLSQLIIFSFNYSSTIVIPLYTFAYLVA